MPATAYHEFKYPRSLLCFLLVPVISLVAVLTISWGLGCSEYAEFQSESCQAVGEYFGIDVYQFLRVPYLISFYASSIALPIGIVLALVKRLVNSHRRREVSQY